MRLPHALAAVALLSGALQAAPAMAGSPTAAVSIPTLAPLLDKVRPAVVTIQVIGERYQESELTPGADQTAPPKQPFKSGGSGVIFDAERGLIGTNDHVVKDAIAIRVGLHDGRITAGKLVGVDVATDIAILKIDLPGLTSLPLGNSDNLKVGDFVIAVGSPFGLEGTATAGIVSGLMRSDVGYEIFESFIQIDAAVNPGNSGGALVNLHGELVGINTAIAGGRSNIGIGFAIPINMAKRIGQQILRHGHMPRGSIGLSTRDISLEMAQSLKLPSLRGAVVTDVAATSPAQAAGIKPDDIIVRASGEEIRTNADYMARIGSTALGESLDLELVSMGAIRTVSVTVADLKTPATVIQIPEDARGIGGLALSSIGPGSSLYGVVRGAAIVSVADQSEARNTGFKPGDVIAAIDQETINEADQVLSMARRKRPMARVKINRNGIPYWLQLPQGTTAAK